MSQNCELEQREEESYGNHEETYVPAQRLTVPTQIQIECRRVDSRPMLELVLGGQRCAGRVSWVVCELWAGFEVWGCFSLAGGIAVVLLHERHTGGRFDSFGDGAGDISARSVPARSIRNKTCRRRKRCAQIARRLATSRISSTWGTVSLRTPRARAHPDPGEPKEEE
jgi:hypothetical protein